MPSYTYKCSQCGDVRDTVESIKSDPRGQRCEKCDVVMDRQIGRTSFSFKGGAPTPKFSGRRR